MDFLIILKWLTNYGDSNKAPSIIETMINLILKPFDVPETPVFLNNGDL